MHYFGGSGEDIQCYDKDGLGLNMTVRELRCVLASVDNTVLTRAVTFTNKLASRIAIYLSNQHRTPQVMLWLRTE